MAGRIYRAGMGICLLYICVNVCPAQQFDEEFETWPVNLKIAGTIIASCDSQGGSQELEAFWNAAGGEQAKIALLHFGKEPEDLRSLQTRFVSAAEFRVIPVNPGMQLPVEEHLNWLNGVTGVWIQCQQRLTESDQGWLVENSSLFRDLIARGGVLRADQHATPLLSCHYLADNTERGPLPNVKTGLNLIPDTVIYHDYDSTDQSCFGNLCSVLAWQPRCVGIGIEPETAILLRQRKITVLGPGRAHFVVAANQRKPYKVKSVERVPDTRRMDPYRYRVDLTAWRREAIDRTLAEFPAQEPDPPFVENGTLVIVGGGGMPDGLMNQFVEFAGGKDARLIYVPCSEQDEIPAEPRLVQSWRELGVQSATCVHTKDRNKANSDSEFLEPLRTATGIWFGGGRQWNFSDSYYGTTAHKLMKQVLQRGGVIGGSSAGASIQGRYLARANPLANFDIMADGYERGLGFLSGVAIDQHFSQRRRQKDMTSLVNRYPQLLGIGIDEATAIIVRKSTAEVVGRGRVFFYDRNRKVLPDQPDYVAVAAGGVFDMSARRITKQPDQNTESESEPEDDGGS